MPHGNPFTALAERVTVLESTVASLNTRVASLETTVHELGLLVEQLKQNQLKWSVPFRFSMPPLQV